MEQAPVKRQQRRLSMRRLPRRTSRVACRRGLLGLGPNVAMRLLDISECGARLLVKVQMEQQQEVELTLLPPGGAREVVRKGVVVWSVPTDDGAFCVGVCFDKRIDYSALCDLSTLASH